VGVAGGQGRRSEELEAFDQRVTQIADTEVDIISLSDGFYDVNKFTIYPRLEDGLGCYVDLAATSATRLGKPAPAARAVHTCVRNAGEALPRRRLNSSRQVEK
jgi:hypothetical protein